MPPEAQAVLSVEELEIRYAAGKGDVVAVAGTSFSLKRGECFGLVGESGCGKSTIAMAIMRCLGKRGRISGGRILFDGQDLAGISAQELRAIRGRRIAIVYQDASTALNPTMTIGAQMREVRHGENGEVTSHERAVQMLRAVGLPDPEGAMRRFPHQLSGGQQQRVVIAMAFLAEPDLLILDEPTTALDVTVEAQIVDLLMHMRAVRGTTMLFISHNLGLVRRMCDRVGVMYAGQIVEQGLTEAILGAPRHPYTRGLLACIPRLDRGRADYRLKSIAGRVPRLVNLPQTCTFIDRCAHAQASICGRPIAVERTPDGSDIRCNRWPQVPAEEAAYQSTSGGASFALKAPAPKGAAVLSLDQVSKTYAIGRLLGRPIARIRANEAVSFDLHAGETLGIVGESGCGKSTLARIIMGLEVPSGGRITLLGSDVTGQVTSRRTRDQIRNVQMVFQNPDTTLNPSHSVGFILDRAVKKLGSARTARERQAEVRRLLDLVRLPHDVLQMSAARLSGGQKQRIAVARAFAGRPSLVVADEPTSALDTSVKTAILELLLAAQKDSDTALIFISHDLSVVRYVADRVAVMYGGRIVEMGEAVQVFSPPFHPYCEALLSSVPGLDNPSPARPPLAGEVGAQALNGQGCAFAPRCPRVIEGHCRQTVPPLRRPAAGHEILCHHSVEDLRDGTFVPARNAS